MKNYVLFAGLLLTGSLHAQYFYNDIIGTQETNRQMQTYMANKVNSVTVTGYDQRGNRASDYSEYHEVRENGRALKASSFEQLKKSILYSRYDDRGRVISIIDSSLELQSVTKFTYDAAGRITQIENTTRDSANDFNQSELHQWLYNAAGKPERMWRIITASNAPTDSLEIRFVTDEDGNTGEERTYRKGYETGYVYYYYDDKNRLSDIVRFNTKLKKLLPDLMFEYDDQDRVIQKITTLSNLTMGGYLIWRYIFNDKGLKTKEALFNKDKELTGKVDYVYTFQQ